MGVRGPNVRSPDELVPVLLICWSAGRGRAPGSLARQLVCPDKSSSWPNPRSLTPTNCLSCTKPGWLWPPSFTSRKNSFGRDLNSKSRINGLLHEETSPAVYNAKRQPLKIQLHHHLFISYIHFLFETTCTKDLIEDGNEDGRFEKLPLTISEPKSKCCRIKKTKQNICIFP